VALAVGAVAFGLPLLNTLVSAGRPIPAGTELSAGRGVRLQLPGGWHMEGGPESGGSSVTIHRGPTTLEVRTAPSEGSLAEAYGRVADQLRGARGVQLFTDASTVVTPSGLVGRRGSYAGPTVEGRFLVLDDGDTTIVATLKAPPGELRDGVDDANRVLRTLRRDAT